MASSRKIIRALRKSTATFFRLVYAGTLPSYADPWPLFDTLDMLLERGLIDDGDFKMCFYGETPQILRQRLRGRLCERVVKIAGTVERHRFLATVKNSTALLLLAYPKERGVLTSKVFEYLGAGRPVVSVPADGDVIDAFLRETGAGASGNTPEEIGKIIAEYYGEWKARGYASYRGDPDVIARYTRKTQVAKLAGILDEVIERKSDEIRYACDSIGQMKIAN